MFTHCASCLEQTRVEGYLIAPPFLPLCHSLPLSLSGCMCVYLPVCLPLALARTPPHTLFPSLPLPAYAPSLRLSQSSLSPLSPHSLYPIAPASRNIFATSAKPESKANCSGFSPYCGEGEAVSAQASCIPYATNSKASPPPTLRRSRYVNCVCSALPPPALHPPPTHHWSAFEGSGCVRVQQLRVGACYCKFNRILLQE